MERHHSRDRRVSPGSASSARIGQRLPPEVMLPAPGQGALAVTARDGDDKASSAARARRCIDAAYRAGGAGRAGVSERARGRVPGAGGGARGDERRHAPAAGRVVALGGERVGRGGGDGAGGERARRRRRSASRWRSGCSTRAPDEILAAVRARVGARRPRALMRGTVVVTSSAGTFPGLLEALAALPVAVEECPAHGVRAAARLARRWTARSTGCTSSTRWR